MPKISPMYKKGLGNEGTRKVYVFEKTTILEEEGSLKRTPPYHFRTTLVAVDPSANSVTFVKVQPNSHKVIIQPYLTQLLVSLKGGLVFWMGPHPQEPCLFVGAFAALVCSKSLAY